MTPMRGCLGKFHHNPGEGGRICMTRRYFLSGIMYYYSGQALSCYIAINDVLWVNT